MSVINYAIEVKTDKSKSANYSYGFDGSTFRWITGRPGYDGSYGLPYAVYKNSNQDPRHYWRFNNTSPNNPSTDVIDVIDIHDSTLLTAVEGTYHSQPASLSINDNTRAMRGYVYGLSSNYSSLRTDATDALVLDAWVKFDSIPSEGVPVIRFSNYPSNVSYFDLAIQSSYFNNILRATIIDPATETYIAVSAPTPSVGEWHYIVYVFNNNTASLYLDGILQQTGTGSLTQVCWNVNYLQFSSGSTKATISDIAISHTDWFTNIEHRDWYNYIGDPTIMPKWEDGSDNTHVWAEGWILQDEIGETVRSVNISATGDYGSISGFDFSLSNAKPADDAKALWKMIRDESIYFTNRKITLYIIIEDVFYAVWSGVIMNNPIEEVGYKFKCQDSFQKIHKVIPPNVVDRNILPNSDDDSQGKSIPVCIGNVTYVKILTVTNKPTEQILVLSSPLPPGQVEGKAAAAVEYDTHTVLPGDTDPTPRLRVYTKDKTFAADALKDKFLYVTRGGGFSDVDVLNQIVKSDATDANGFTWIYLESPFEFVDEATFNSRYAYDPYSKEDTIHYYPEIAAEYQCWERQMYEPGTSNFWKPGVYSSHQYPPTPAPAEDTNWIKWTDVDMSNNGVGCSVIGLLVDIEPYRDCIITIRKDAYDGEILGTKTIMIMDVPEIQHWENITIKRQYDAAVTLVIQVTGNITQDNYYDFPYLHRKGVSIFDRPPVMKIYDMVVMGAESSEDTWWFSIVDMGGTHLVSNNSIQEVVSKDGQILLYVYDKNRKVMEPVPGNIYKVITNKTGTTGHPEFILYSSNINKDGEVKYYVPIVPKKWSLEVEPNMRYTSRKIGWQIAQQGHIEANGFGVQMINQDYALIRPDQNICNKNQTNPIQVLFPDYLDFKNTYALTLRMEYPTEYLNYEVEEIYVCLDANFIALPKPPSEAPVCIRVIIYVDVLDVYGNVINSQQYDDPDSENQGDIVWPTDEIPTETTINFNSLPSFYYANNGTTETPYKNQWNFVGKDYADEDVTLRSMLKLKSELWDAIKDGTSSNVIQMRIVVTSNATTYTGGAPFTCYMQIKEAGIVGLRTTNPLNDDYYCRLKGETVNGEETSNVYNAFRLMLETYDGIPASNIDYTNLPVVRKDWSVGRQLTERKSSFEYVKELAQHSFVAVYPKRNGDRGLKAWREDTNIVKAFNQSNIIRGTIKGWERTDVSDLYNTFRLWYNWSPAANTYIDSITLTYTDQYYPVVGGVTAAIAGFPGATMMLDYPSDKEVWRTYVGGVSPDSYSDAETMWRFAHESYDIAGATQELTKSLSELPWYINTRRFEGAESGIEASKADSPFMYLFNLAMWCTIQKEEVKFNIPITAENVVLELLDPITFSDTIYTDNTVRIGWITGIEIIPTKNYIRITAMLTPELIKEDLIIRERGQILNFNKYTESGSETGVLLDGQGRI